MEYINLYWEGPFNLSEIVDKNNENEDFGVYQIYGSHPVYGSNVLLYIGQANKQVFYTRIKQEEHWWYNQDSDSVTVYLGRLIGETPSLNKWESMITKAEKLLIYAHRPAHNSSNINSIKQEELTSTHVLNWGNYKSLLAEVSSMRIFDETNEKCEDNFSLNKI